MSSPDIFNSDVADLSGGTKVDINNTFPDPDAYASAMSSLAASGFTRYGKNSLTAGMARVYNQLLAEMQSHAGGNANTFLVAGDLVSGHWPDGAKLNDNFGGAKFGEAIDNAADIYYGWHRELFRQHGFTNYIAAIGDHDIGDNNWSPGSKKAENVGRMKRAFGRSLVKPLGLPPRWNGMSSFAPPGSGEYDEGSYVTQIKNVLFVTVDVFRWEGDDPDSALHPWFGAVTAEITGSVGDSSSHLGWLDAILTAADSDPTVDHVIVQGHTPVLPGVRKQSSSGMMMQLRDDSPFWQVLRAHSHQKGGKVRLYFGGEVHTSTATKDAKSDIVQLVHGNPPLGDGQTNYVVFSIDGKQIDAKLYQVELHAGGGTYWQMGKPTSNGVGRMSPGQLAGTMTIDANGTATNYQNSGYLRFVDYRGLILNYKFDENATATEYENSATLQDLYYNVIAKGNVSTVPGKFGRALATDGSGDYVKTDGGLAPISEGEPRTLGAWVKTSRQETQAILGYGQKKVRNGEFNLQLHHGKLQLYVDAADGGRRAIANNPPINDGEWHHVAVVLPGVHENKLRDVLFYVDGVQYTPETSDPSQAIRTFAGSNSKIHIGANAENLKPSEHFQGLIDDVTMWGAPLSTSKLRAVYEAGSFPQLEISALDMESLFDLFDAQKGTAHVTGIEWRCASDLPGNGGEVLDLGSGNLAIVLDDSGKGVVGFVKKIDLASQPR